MKPRDPGHACARRFRFSGKPRSLLSAVHRQENTTVHITNLDVLITAIENHTALKLAGLQFPERLRVLEQRREQIGGMLELARRLNLERRFIRFLELQRDTLQAEIDGP